MKHLDFTIDFETVGLTGNSAPMTVAVVPWTRDGKLNPWLPTSYGNPLNMGIDLRTCVIDGFDFAPDTLKWWAAQSEPVKESVVQCDAKPLVDVLHSIQEYINGFKVSLGVNSVCLWAQGPDIDIAILRTICQKYDVFLEDIVAHTQFRDCRTLILEAALIEAERSMGGTSTKANGIALPHQVMKDPSLAYKIFDPLPSVLPDNIKCYGRLKHDALYDAVRSSWYTWQALRILR